MKRLLASSLMITFFGVTFAVSPDAFQIEVSPSSFAVNQAVDFTIKAIKNKQVMKNYTGMVFMSVDGIAKDSASKLKLTDATISNGGILEMGLADQGVKKYTKGLLITKPGNFTVSVADFTQDTISGSTTVMVSSDFKAEVRNIQILSPSAGSEENQSTINVMATADTLPNARVQILLNDALAKETTTDANGLINDTISGLKVGTNVLQIKALSVTNEQVGSSEKLVFTYQGQSGNLLKSFTATPNQNLKVGNKVRFELTTEDNVSSAKLIFPDNKEYPLDKEKDGLFSKELMLTQTGSLDVASELSAGPTLSKKYDKMLTLEVADNTQIGEVKIQALTTLAGAIQLDWKVIGGSSPAYAIQYGLTKDDLAGTAITKETTATLSGFTYGKDYFFKIQPLNIQNIADGLPSDVLEFTMPIASGTGPNQTALSASGLEMTPDHPTAALPTCVVKNIKVSTQKIGNKYYLVRNKIENATKYLVYKSDFADNSDKSFLGETELTRFEYPFDKTSKEDVYAYYTVEALCADGNKAVLTEAQKVKVGPVEDMMLILTLTMLGYLIYRLYSYREE
ncbi:hypothetical protein HXK74_02570 [Candidatus Gracilibacteria bacterium]|nr:hypothetical protein [Candidatus Gracilibacteria bacterium]